MAFGVAGAYRLWQRGWQPIDRLSTGELRRAIPPPPSLPIPLASSPIAVHLNFGNWGLSRNPADESPRMKAPVLRHGKLSVTIQLPLLSPPGTYRVVLSGGNGLSLINQTVEARIINGMTLLNKILVDTTVATPGMYRLAILRAGASVPRYFPVRIE